MSDRTIPNGPPTITGLTFLQPLGSGGYADVYLYEQAMPRRRVAVKVLKGAGLTESLRRQFTAEANSMAELADHPNIVPVFSADITADGRPYIVMMYYPRDNLSVRAANERFSVAEVLRIGIQISSAVETAHRAGILHRDIKPGNILTSQFDVPGLADFGISAQIAELDEDDDTGLSVPWSPPEVLYATSPATVRSDVYSLAATLWHLLTGRAPFELPRGEPDSQLAMMGRIRDTSPSAIGRPDVPTSLDRTLRQAMSRDPAARPLSAAAFARDLQSVEQELRLPRTEMVVLSDAPLVVKPRVLNDSPPTRVSMPMRVEGQAAAPAPVNTNAPPLIAYAPLDRTVDRSSLAAGHVSPASLPTDQNQVGRARADEPRAPALPATERRHVASPTFDAASPTPTRRGLRPVYVIGAIVVVAIAAAIGGVLIASSSGSSSPSHSPTTAPAGGSDEAGDLPPGLPTITAVRANPTTLHFSWTYANKDASDTYRWQLADGSKGATVTSAAVDVADPAGTQVCIQIKVIRADGSNAALDWSTPGCGS